MSNANEVATIEQSRELVSESMTAGVLSDKHIQARVNMIQGAIKHVFKKDVHYGIIPGTQKPTLYKPGAEQLLVMFRIASLEPKIEDISTPDCVRYRVTRGGASQADGRFLGAGVGECSSDEEKYKWRRPVCDQEYEETPADRRREVWKKYQGKVGKSKQVRTSPADVANTILKMADKRALVAMTLVVTGASDAFNQDIEDLPEEIRESVLEDGAERPPIQQPARASTASVAPAGASTAPAEPPATPSDVIRRVSENQARRFYAIWKAAGKTKEQVLAYLQDTFGIERDTEIPADGYEDACKWAQAK